MHRAEAVRARAASRREHITIGVDQQTEAVGEIDHPTRAIDATVDDGERAVARALHAVIDGGKGGLFG